MHDALHRLGIPAALERVILVNGENVSPDQRLGADDIIDVFPPLAGGGGITYDGREIVARGS